jgi:hypothetical protein
LHERGEFDQIHGTALVRQRTRPEARGANNQFRHTELRMKASSGLSLKDTSTSQLIDAKIKALGDWRGKRLSQLRAVIKKADASMVEEVKWKKPSNPMGVPVWSHDGIVCIGEALKNAVRLTFPKGASMKDPKKLFNARLDSNSVRAADFHEGDAVDEAALKALILEAVRLNELKVRKR